MIELKNIRKTFRVTRRAGGFGNAVKSFFSREYETVEALADVSFRIGDGETVGYIGPNGAGKSSTIKVMSGILTPDSGECVIDGLVPWKQRKEHVRHIGVVFGQRSGLWWDVPVGDSFELLCGIYSVDRDEYRRNLDRLCEMLSLGDLLKTPTRQLSLGQRMRCEIAAALIHSPDILFLDEPTIGLDALSKLAVREFITSLNRERGTTVLLTTHDMQDIEALTNRIILIGKGRILLDGELSSLRKRFEGTRRLTVTYTGQTSAETLIAGLNGIVLTENHISTGSSHAVFAINDGTPQGTPVSKLITKLSEQIELTDVTVDAVPIEEIVRNMYREYGI